MHHCSEKGAKCTPGSSSAGSRTISTPLLRLQLERCENEKRAAIQVAGAKFKALNKSKFSQTSAGRQLLDNYAEIFTAVLVAVLQRLLANPSKAGYHFAAWPLLLQLQCSSTHQMTAAILVTVIDRLPGQPPVEEMALAIGTALQGEMKGGRLLRQNPSLLQLNKRNMAGWAFRPGTLRTLGVPDPRWGRKERQELGMFCLGLIRSDLDLLEFQDGRGSRVRPTAAARQIIKSASIRPSWARVMPLLVPPLPWKGLTGGGQLGSERTLVSTTQPKDLSYLTVANTRGLRLAANVLQGNALQVNSWMLELQRDAWERNIPGLFGCTRDPQLQWMEKPERGDMAGRIRYQRLLMQNRIEREQHAGRRCQVREALRHATELNGGAFWQAWHADWRGRLYTQCVVLTHQGPDFMKALLEFVPEQPAGPDGLDHLLRAAATHYGKGKERWGDRHRWALHHIPMLQAVANDPMGQLGVIRKAKDPWQFVQLAKAIAEQLEDPTRANGCPVRFDQSCSGVGIIAALTRDETLAKYTNLTGEGREDIYNYISSKTIDKLRGLLDDEDERTVAMAEFWLKHGISRDMAKEAMLLHMYGSKFIRVADKLCALLEKEKPNMPMEEWQEAYIGPTKFLARHLIDTIAAETIAARRMGEWLQRAARHCIRRDVPLRFTSPAGMPIDLGMQPTARRHVRMAAMPSATWTRPELPEEQRPVCIRNTKKSLVPSFIHSFDAALVHRMAWQGEWEMAPMATNHDCFCTTAAHAGWLHNSLLAEFRAIYREDWMERIRAEIYCATGGLRMQRMKGMGQLAPEEIGMNPHLFG